MPVSNRKTGGIGTFQFAPINPMERLYKDRSSHRQLAPRGAISYHL